MDEITDEMKALIESQDSFDPDDVCEPVEFMDGELIEGVVTDG